METLRLRGERGLFRDPIVRYAILIGLTDRFGVDGVIAFGFADAELRLVVDGLRITRGLIALKIAIGRLTGGRVAGVVRAEVGAGGTAAAIAWAHRAPIDAGDVLAPLDSPWTSHRDLLGYRRADFYDAHVVDVDAREVHALAGGGPIPTGWPPARPQPEPLTHLLHVAASVLGVLTSDRRCFRLFTHLALARGWAIAEVARALLVTPRRVRQLANEGDDGLAMAMRCMTLEAV